jgi:exodeoxyribonuclease VII large subunit
MSQLSFLERLIRERRALTVSELTAQVKILIENQFLDAWVEGEVSNFRRHTSGHWYFTLKDEGAMLRCASFRMQNRLIRFAPEDGLSVRARGRLSLYEARGEYQMLVDYLEPVGIGALQLAFEQLRSRLAAEGLFDAERKRRLPLMPGCIGVVTSPTGAAVRDILRVIKRRNEAVSVLIAPARVQGEGSGAEVARAIEMLCEREEVDVIIVGRGGGSAEDLWCFNEECVARAIYNSRVPVISAVGHETDVTISDFVADLRASTPSAAAEIVTTALDDMRGHVEALKEGLATATRFKLLEGRNRLSELDSSRAFGSLLGQVRSAAQRFDEALYSIESALRQSIKQRRREHEAFALRLKSADLGTDLAEQGGRLALLASRIEAATRAGLDREGERVAVGAGKLEALSPLAVLARGYAIAFDGEGRTIKRAADVAKGERIRVRVAEGEIDCLKD